MPWEKKLCKVLNAKLKNLECSLQVITTEIFGAKEREI